MIFLLFLILKKREEVKEDAWLGIGSLTAAEARTLERRTTENDWSLLFQFLYLNMANQGRGIQKEVHPVPLDVDHCLRDVCGYVSAPIQWTVQLMGGLFGIHTTASEDFFLGPTTTGQQEPLRILSGFKQQQQHCQLPPKHPKLWGRICRCEGMGAG